MAGQKYVESIEKIGLVPKSRLYVHLSDDMDTAVKVGSRHGKPAVYRVASGRMQEDGLVFYRSVNDVWLVKEVPMISCQTRDIVFFPHRSPAGSKSKRQRIPSFLLYGGGMLS